MTDADVWQQMEFDLGLPSAAPYVFPMVPSHRYLGSHELYSRCPACHSTKVTVLFHTGEHPCVDDPCWLLWLSQPYFLSPYEVMSSEPTPLSSHLDCTCRRCHHQWVGSLTDVVPDLYAEVEP